MSGNARHSATIFKKKDGTFGIDIRQGKPVPPDDVEVIEVLHQKDDETMDDFKERVVRFLNEEYP